MPDPTVEAPPPPRGRRIPADYYAMPPGEGRRLFPRWVPLGCGGAALVFLILAFAGGAIVAKRGLGNLMDPLLGSMAGEVESMYAKDVSPAQRHALAAEMDRLRAGVRSERVPVASLDPVMKELREAISDQQMSAQETEKLTATIRRINEQPAPARAPHR